MRPGTSASIRTAVVGLLVVAGLLGLAAVARDGERVGRCRDAERSIDPSPLHVVGANEVSYDLSPPTSGPHQVPAPAPGVYEGPIAEPLQVGALESGLVLVQYDATIDADEVQQLVDAVPGTDTIVAPVGRPIDDAAHVALTAWGVRQLCAGIDVDTVTSFVDDHLGSFFVSHGES